MQLFTTDVGPVYITSSTRAPVSEIGNVQEAEGHFQMVVRQAGAWLHCSACSAYAQASALHVCRSFDSHAQLWIWSFEQLNIAKCPLMSLTDVDC